MNPGLVNYLSGHKFRFAADIWHRSILGLTSQRHRTRSCCLGHLSRHRTPVAGEHADYRCCIFELGILHPSWSPRLRIPPFIGIGLGLPLRHHLPPTSPQREKYSGRTEPQFRCFYSGTLDPTTLGRVRGCRHRSGGFARFALGRNSRGSHLHRAHDFQTSQ